MASIKKAIRNYFTVYCREFKLIIHDAGILLFFAFLPLVYPIIYSLIYNPELVKEVPVVVVDNDRTAISRELIRNFDACDEAHVIGYAADLNEARHAMNSHKCFAIFEIPEGFGKKIGRDETANAVLYSDMSLLLRYRGFLVATTDIMTSMGSELLTKKINEIVPLAETIAVGDPLPIDYVPMGNIRNGFDSFIMPGVLILIVHQLIVLAVGMAGGAKRENPRLVGYVADNEGKSVLGTMIAQTLAYFTLLIVPIIFMIHYVPLIFKFPMAGDTWQILMFLLPMIIACFGVGFAFQSVVTERESVFVLWVVTSLIFLLLSGLIWPRYDMWPVWRAFSAICPSTWGVEGFIKMNANGASLSQVSDCYINLWILAVAWWIVGWMARKWVIRPAVARRYGLSPKQIKESTPENI